MPNPAVRISAEFTGLEASAQRALNKLAGGGGLKIPINDRQFNTAITGMTANMKRFEQSLDFSNRRVIAFGTSASIVYGTVRAFNELVKSTIEVEKVMTSINSIMGLTGRQLETMSRGLFTVARDTGQSFAEVAKAAEEFSRQGLGMQETMKRTRDVMILMRLTGLDAAQAVGTMTAAVNTFAKAGEDSTSILNKVVAADQKFAVSARDIAEAFQRVGSVVDDAGVSIDQFIGLVTAAKQITSREGAVIGNSLKTILTRMERSTTLDDLEALGIAVRDASGNAKPALAVFTELAKTYNTLGREQQNLVAQLGGGVFQINQFKALMMDLGKANGISAQAERAAANATNEALVRNAALNGTLSTSLQNLKTNATEAASVIGSLSIKPMLKEGIDLGNMVTGIFTRGFGAKSTGDSKPGEDFGAYIGESILKGIGNVLAGPGLVFVMRAVIGLFNRARPEILSDIKSAAAMVGRRPGSIGKITEGMMGGRGEAESISRVNQLVAQGTKEEQARYAAARNVAKQEEAVLAILERQAMVTAEMAGIRRAAAATVLAEEGALGSPLTAFGRNQRRTPRGAGGYIPIGEEMGAIMRGVGGAPSNARPVYLPSFDRGGGQRGIVANTSEWMVKTAAGGAIFNRDMVKRFGLPPGATPVAAEGHIPNAAFGVYLGATTPSTPAPSYPFGVAPGGPYAPIVGGGGGAAMGQGFGQYTAAAEKALLEKQAQNAAYEARVLAQREAMGKGEAQEWAAEKARIRAVEADVMSKWDPAKMIYYMGRNRQGESPTPPNLPMLPESPASTAMDLPAEATGTTRSARRTRQSAAFDRVLAQRRAERAQLQADLQAQRRAGIREQRAGRLQNNLLLASFGTGFIPQGTSGEATGMLSGAASGGLQGAATGAFLGSVFGPVGTFVGAGIGGMGGAIKGFIDRMQKSFDEIAAEITKDNAKLKEEMDAVGRAFELQEQLVEGGKSGMTRMQLARLQKELNVNLSKVRDPEVLKLLMGGGPDAIRKASEIEADKASALAARGGIRTTFSQAIGQSMGLGGATPQEVTSAAEAQAGQFANASTAQLALMARRLRDPEYAAARGKMLGGENWIQRLESFFPGLSPGFLGTRANENAVSFVQDSGLGALRREMERRSLMEKAKGQMEGGNANYISRVESLALASRMGVAGQIAQVRAGGANQVEQVRQQIALEAPGMTDMRRLGLQGIYGKQNIISQFDMQRKAIVASGTSALIQSLGEAGVKNRDLIEGRLAKVTGKSDLIDLQRDMTSVFASKAPAETLRKAQEALSDLIGRLTVLNATEEEAIKTNDQTNALLTRQLSESKTVRAVEGNLRQNLLDEREKQTLIDQAVINLSQSKNSSLITGDMLTASRLGQADRLGRQGMSKDSFMGGFGAVFAGGKQELLNFAEVGHQVAASMSNDFSEAFGDFVTGAKKGKDAFRDFVLSVLRDSARIFATKAITGLLGMAFGDIGSNISKPVTSAAGGPIGYASGGMVPTMLTGGEYVYTPAQAARIGASRLNAINSGTMRFAPGGLVMGGSGVRDDVFQPLAAGSYVIRRSMVDRNGAGNLASLAIGYDDGGLVSGAMSTPSALSAVGGGGGVFTIGVTINDNSSSSSSSSNPKGNSLADRQFGETLARRIKTITLQTIEEQKRGAGLLRPQSNLRTT